MSWLNLGASLASTALQSAGASKAAKRQEQAAQAAAAKLEGQFQEGKQLQLPYYNAGTDALQQLMGRLPELTAGYDPSRLTSEPGYEFGRTEGLRALEGTLAAQGLTDSGAALKRAARYGTDYATTKLNDAFNRDRATRNDAFGMLMGASGYGERAGTNIATQGNQTAGQIAKLITGAGDVGAANDVAQGNMWGDLLNLAGSKLKGPAGNVATAGGAGWGTGNAFGNQDLGMYLADGGRVEPVVGTRAPRRAGGGGGGMSRDAVLQALDVAWRDVPAARQPGTVATLPADPTRNPGAILDDRMRKAGAYAEGGAVRSKEPGRADTVKARLSGGEFVIDAATVAKLGEGNTEAGFQLLEDLVRRVKAHQTDHG